MKLNRVIRLDSIPLDSTYYTEEGYLIDIPIVTTCGVFEYKNEDGSIRKELRLPEDVFSESSLASYEGKPIIVTHNAGAVNKDNVAREQIGTIISKGMRDGNNVRAKIVIHNTDQMLKSGLRELSLGYSLETDDTPGVWNGQPYDCIQRNIEINHLALVKEARAGDSARLNIDGKDDLEGGKIVEENKTIGNELSPEELEAAIALYKSHKAAGNVPSGEGADGGGEPKTKEEEPTAGAEEPKEPEQSPADRIRAHMKRLEEDDGGQDPSEVITQLKENISALLDECDRLTASRDMAADSGTEPADGQEPVKPEKKENTDGKESFNMDNIDAMVSEKLDVCRIAEKLNLDGVENVSIMEGKKKVIAAVHPKMNLDGKTDAYVNAAYDIAKQSVKDRKSTDMQREHLFGKDEGFRADSLGKSDADQKRQEMIKEMLGGNE